MKNNSLDDILDGYSLARESGAALQEWQGRYPDFADDLAEFEAFLSIGEKMPDPPLSEEDEQRLIERANRVVNQVLST